MVWGVIRLSVDAPGVKVGAGVQGTAPFSRVAMARRSDRPSGLPFFVARLAVSVRFVPFVVILGVLAVVRF